MALVQCAWDNSGVTSPEIVSAAWHSTQQAERGGNAS